MEYYEIKYLLGGYGERAYSDEICRTSKGIAWYDGLFWLKATDRFYNWKEMSMHKAAKLIGGNVHAF